MYMETLTHNSSRTAMLSDLLMNRTYPQDRPDVLKYIVESWHCIPSRGGMPSSEYRIEIELTLMEELKEKTNGRIANMTSYSLELRTSNEHSGLYTALYHYIPVMSRKTLTFIHIKNKTKRTNMQVMKYVMRRIQSTNLITSFGVHPKILHIFSKVSTVIPLLCFKLYIVLALMPYLSIRV